MHTRRLATFLLGAWLGGSLLMILLQAANLRLARCRDSADNVFMNHRPARMDQCGSRPGPYRSRMECARNRASERGNHRERPRCGPVADDGSRDLGSS